MDPITAGATNALNQFSPIAQTSKLADKVDPTGMLKSLIAPAMSMGSMLDSLPRMAGVAEEFRALDVPLENL